jgi:FixJ family two-component response regulator
MATGAVLLLDDDADVREAIGDLVRMLSERECLLFASFAALAAERPRALACDVAVLDVNLGPGQPDGVHAYDWLRAEGFAGRIVFLTGHAGGHPLVRRAATIDGVRILHKPVGIEALCAAIDLRVAA